MSAARPRAGSAALGALLGLTLGGPWARAQAPPAAAGPTASTATRPETLTEAWEIAIAHNPTLAAAGSQLAAARAQARAAGDARWPSLQVQAGITRLNASPALDVFTPGFVFRSGPIFRNDQFVSGSLQVSVPLYAGGGITAGIAAARSGVAQARDEQASTLASLKLEVARSYVSVLRTRRALAAAQAGVDSLRAQAGDVQRLVRSGTVARSDLLAARVALANAEQDRLVSANDVLLAEADYNRLLGEPLARVPHLAAQLPVDRGLASLPLERLIARALAGRSELQALAARAQALDAQARAELATMLPQVALTGAYTHFDNQILDRENFASVGVGVRWHLFDGGQARNRADALRSQSRALNSRLAAAREAVQLQVRRAWLDLQAARARLRGSRAAVMQADDNLRMALELYRAGMGTNTRVLEAVALRTRATGNFDNAVLDRSLALLELAYAVGAF